jgi:hypothetical protein
MLLVQNGNLIMSLLSGDENIETGTTPTLQGGTYIADLRDWRYADVERAVGYPSVVCFNVSFTSTP